MCGYTPRQASLYLPNHRHGRRGVTNTPVPISGCSRPFSNLQYARACGAQPAGGSKLRVGRPASPLAPKLCSFQHCVTQYNIHGGGRYQAGCLLPVGGHGHRKDWAGESNRDGISALDSGPPWQPRLFCGFSTLLSPGLSFYNVLPKAHRALILHLFLLLIRSSS